MAGQLSVRTYSASDWGWVQECFEDDILQATLDPLDDEWLRAATTGIDGLRLVVHDEQSPVGLVEVIWDPDGRRHVVTDLAICLTRRRMGFDHRTLVTALSWDGHPPTRGWTAFVQVDNHAAKAFFRTAG